VKRVPEYLLLLYSLSGTLSIAVSQAVMGAGLVAAALDRGRAMRWRRIGLEGPVLAWALAAALATAFATDPAESLDKMRKIVLFAMAWWAPAVVVRRWGLGRLYMGLLFGAGTTSLYGVLTFFLQGGPALAVRINGFHGFYLTNSGLLLLCTFPAVLFAACRGAGASYRWGAGLAAASILAAQLLGRLPGAWIGTAAGFLFLAARRRRALPAVAAAGTALALLLLPGIFQSSARDMVNPASPGNVERARVWENGLKLFAADPLTGWGLQDLRADYALVKDPGDPDEGHMASVPVQIAASMGAPGLLAFGWLLFALFRRLGDARRRAKDDPFLLAVAEGAECGLVAFLAAGLVEWNLGDSEILALLFFLVGTAIAAGRLAEGGATGDRRAPAAMAGAGSQAESAAATGAGTASAAGAAPAAAPGARTA
jgi:hypothetical protein